MDKKTALWAVLFYNPFNRNEAFGIQWVHRIDELKGFEICQIIGGRSKGFK
ncbi:MAG: hypothetical protein ACPGC8_02170 [Flavobacteriaceae bacterium]